FGERRLENTTARAADSVRIGEGFPVRLAGRILRNRDETRNAAAFLVLSADETPRALRRDQDDVQILTGFDLLVVDVEAVGEQQRRAFLEALLNFLVERLLREVRHEH